jgi:hypothetical protein
MARKTKLVTISADGRDRGKCFLITEMVATRAEDWAARLLFSLDRAIDLPDDVMELGAAAVLSMGISVIRGLHIDDAKPLLDEMMACVEFVPDPSKKDAATGNPVAMPLFEEHIEEVATRLLLRAEVVELHTGFSVTAALSRLGEAVKDQLNGAGAPMSLEQSTQSLPGADEGWQPSMNSKPSTD